MFMCGKRKQLPGYKLNIEENERQTEKKVWIGEVNRHQSERLQMKSLKIFSIEWICGA